MGLPHYVILQHGKGYMVAEVEDELKGAEVSKGKADAIGYRKTIVTSFRIGKIIYASKKKNSMEDCVRWLAENQKERL